MNVPSQRPGMGAIPYQDTAHFAYGYPLQTQSGLPAPSINGLLIKIRWFPKRMDTGLQIFPRLRSQTGTATLLPDQIFKRGSNLIPRTRENVKKPVNQRFTGFFICPSARYLPAFTAYYRLFWQTIGRCKRNKNSMLC